MKNLFATAAFATILAAPVVAETYVLDPSHSQIVFNYDHLGFSTSYGMFSGFDGEIVFDQEDPAASSVNVSFSRAHHVDGLGRPFRAFHERGFLRRRR